MDFRLRPPGSRQPFQARQERGNADSPGHPDLRCGIVSEIEAPIRTLDTDRVSYPEFPRQSARIVPQRLDGKAQQGSPLPRRGNGEGMRPFCRRQRQQGKLPRPMSGPACIRLDFHIDNAGFARCHPGNPCAMAPGATNTIEQRIKRNQATTKRQGNDGNAVQRIALLVMQNDHGDVMESPQQESKRKGFVRLAEPVIGDKTQDGNQAHGNHDPDRPFAHFLARPDQRKPGSLDARPFGR